MVSPGRKCAICLQDLPVTSLQEGEHIQDGDKTQVDPTEGPGDDLQRFPPDEVLRTCSESHILEICYGCHDLYISTALDTRGPGACETIQCPQVHCGHTYTFDEIKNITSPATFSRYDELLTRKILGDIPNFRWCLRPGCDSGAIYCADDVWEELGCRGIVFHPDTRLTEPGRWIQCRACGFAMCFTHQVPCPAKFRSRLEQRKDPIWTLSAQGCAMCRKEILNRGSENSTEEWIAKNTKRCPGFGCGVPIEKDSGCPHMTCAKCQFDFCWDCLEAYNPDHDACRRCIQQRSNPRTQNPSRAAESWASQEILSQAVRSFDHGYSRVPERLRRLQEMGVIEESQTTAYCDPLPRYGQPQPQAMQRRESMQEMQDRFRFTPDQHIFIPGQNQPHLQMQAQHVARNEGARRNTMADIGVPYQNIHDPHRGGTRRLAVPNAPRPAPNTTQAAYNQPGPSSSRSPNTQQPQSGSSSAPFHASMVGMPYAPYGSVQGPLLDPQSGYGSPTYSPTWQGGSVWPLRNALYGSPRVPVPAPHNGPYLTPSHPPVPYGVSQSSADQRQGHQGNHSQGIGRGNVGHSRSGPPPGFNASPPQGEGQEENRNTPSRGSGDA